MSEWNAAEQARRYPGYAESPAELCWNPHQPCARTQTGRVRQDAPAWRSFRGPRVAVEAERLSGNTHLRAARLQLGTHRGRKLDVPRGLAIDVAKRVLERYRDGVWPVELTQVADPALEDNRTRALATARRRVTD